MRITGGEDRFWSKVDASGDCWLWTASTSRLGYGEFRLGGRIRKAHRVAYEMLVGLIPDDLEIDHLCRVRHCVNPDHMEPVTHRVNVLRGASLSAANARKAHCKRGHPFDEENTHIWVRPNGGQMRQCRACDRNRPRRERRSAA